MWTATSPRRATWPIPLALKIAYQTGRVDTGGGSLATVPILDTRGYFDMSGNLARPVPVRW